MLKLILLFSIISISTADLNPNMFTIKTATFNKWISFDYPTYDGVFLDKNAVVGLTGDRYVAHYFDKVYNSEQGIDQVIDFLSKYYISAPENVSDIVYITAAKNDRNNLQLVPAGGNNSFLITSGNYYLCYSNINDNIWFGPQGCSGFYSLFSLNETDCIPPSNQIPNYQFHLEMPCGSYLYETGFDVKANLYTNNFNVSSTDYTKFGIIETDLTIFQNINNITESTVNRPFVSTLYPIIQNNNWYDRLWYNIPSYTNFAMSPVFETRNISGYTYDIIWINFQSGSCVDSIIGNWNNQPCGFWEIRYV